MIATSISVLCAELTGEFVDICDGLYFEPGPGDEWRDWLMDDLELEDDETEGNVRKKRKKKQGPG